MTRNGIGGVVVQIRRAAATQVGVERSDGDLLGDFIDRRDGGAFAALVQRHGSMVLGVCRRLLGHQQDAEDAFQAVFLVLARKAASIAPRNLVGNWLYGVAQQTAIRVRTQNCKRQQRERQMRASIPEPATNSMPSWDDLRPLLDEEMGRLPDRYRAVLVLCDLEGRTRKDEARHLRCPEGSVSSRLARARAMLARRLTRRGVVLSSGTLAALVSEHANAWVARSLVDATLQYASASQRIASIANGVLSAMALKKTVAIAGWALAAILGSTTCGLVAGYLQAGGGQITKTPGEPKKETPAEELVRQLDSNEFQKREAAEKALIELGAAALPAVRAGTKSTKPEVVQRCERIQTHIRAAELAKFTKAFAADTERKAAFDHPIWKRYVAMVGDSKPSRELFARIIKCEDWAKTLDAAEADPANAGELYRAAVREVGERTMANASVGFLIPIWPCDLPEEVAFLLLLGSYKNTDPTYPLSYQDMPSRHFAEGESRVRFGRGLVLAFQGKRLEIDPKKGDRSIEVDDGGGNASESARVMLLLLAHWLEQRNLWIVASEHVSVLSTDQRKTLLPFARRVLADKNAAVLCRAFWVSIVRRFGDKTDVPLLTPLFDDKTGMDWATTNRFGEGPGNVINQAQVREVAIGSAIFLRGRDPGDFGFSGVAGKKRDEHIHSTHFTVKPTGTNDEKEKVLAAAIAWLEAEAKKETPARPKKLGRVLPVSPELLKELDRWDRVYRHGTEAKFAELERLADEWLKKYAEPQDQARILYQVAHVAGQSGIDKQFERVRQYARKSLALNQDPLERGHLHTYLGSAAEVDSTVKDVAERRRRAADELLNGYAEMLAQELPDKAPELPRVEGGEFDMTDPNELGKHRSRQMAQIEARQQAEFTRDLVHRRDTLAKQLSWLYHPHPKIHGRNAEGPQELRNLAVKKLQDESAVIALMAVVLATE